VTDKVTSFAFLAIRGKFVRVASADRREILLVQPGSIRLIKPKAGTWRVRTQALWTISMGTLISTSLVTGILQGAHASVPLQAGSVGGVLTIFILIGSLQQGMILNRLARREGSTSEQLHLKSFKLGRFGHLWSWGPSVAISRWRSMAHAAGSRRLWELLAAFRARKGAP